MSEFNLNKTKLKFNQIHQEMTDKVNELWCLVESNFKNDGDTCEESQRICLLNALKHLDTTINGNTMNDLK